MVILNNIQEDLMPTFMMSLNWTDQGIRAVKDSPKRSEAARKLAKASFNHLVGAGEHRRRHGV